MRYIFDASAKLVAVHVRTKGGLLQALPGGVVNVWDGCTWRAATPEERRRWRGVCDDAIKAAPVLRVFLPVVMG